MSSTSRPSWPGILSTTMALMLLGLASACVSNTCNTNDCAAEQAATSDAESNDATTRTMMDDTKMDDKTEQDAATGTDEFSLEPVADARLEQGAVVATVISNGCTRSEHFHIEYEVVDGVCGITIVRDKPDHCRRAPMPVSLTIPGDLGSDCSSADIVFRNPALEMPAKRLKRRTPDRGDADTTNDNKDTD